MEMRSLAWRFRAMGEPSARGEQTGGRPGRQETMENLPSR
jgi:hypothetical protein